ncbi:MAG TPA: hypothetical protein DCM87_18280 [Planctomycetes bacterium]|nr:hypothetical protein [Planctomycetota bacterium]
MRTIFILVALAGAAAAGDTITTASLLGEMTGMTALTYFPSPRYTTLQFSSFDRRAREPYAPGWFSNADGFGREPIPGFVRTAVEPGADGVGTYVMADVEGPGAIVRTWTAAIDGKIRLYLDGETAPLYDGAAAPFLDNPYAALGGDEGLLAANTFNQREAGYFPVPFARRCLIHWIGNKERVHFYQIQIRRYEPDAKVTTFARDDFTRHAGAVKAAAAALGDARPAPAAGLREEAFDATVAHNERKALLAPPAGPMGIVSFTVRIEAPRPDRALRQTAFRMYFDESPSPQVETPLGDFFGAGPGICPYTSVPFTIAPTGAMTCRFVMPYAKAARIEIENWSGAPLRATGAASFAPYAWKQGESMHFFARFRADHALYSMRHNEVVDLPFLCARGKGVYVGTASILMNPTSVPTPSGGWWGEGDEKIWVDDDDFPSTFGTGSEDYYNYAWSVPDIFWHPYFAQPLTTGPGNRGYVVNNRFHVIDALPFTRSIFFFMELCSHMPTPDLSYARLAYFYAFPGTRDDRVPLTPDTARIPELPPWLPLPAGGCRTAEFIQAEGLDAQGSGVVRRREEPMFAGGAALWWSPARPGDTLALRVPVTAAGKYRIGFTFVQAPECARMQVRIGDTPIFKDGRAIDLGTPHLTMLRSDTGDRVFDLEAGECTLTLAPVAADGNPCAAPIGIDFVWLVK